MTKPKLKSSYIVKLYNKLHMEPNLLTEKESESIKDIHINKLTKEEIKSKYEQSYEKIKEFASRGAYKLHTESLNIRWREQMRNSFVRTMLLDTLKELKTLAKEMDDWRDKIESYSWQVDDLCRELTTAWDYWLANERDILDENTKPKIEEFSQVCSFCARKLGWTIKDEFISNWTHNTCDNCKKYAAVSSIDNFEC